MRDDRVSDRDFRGAVRDGDLMVLGRDGFGFRDFVDLFVGMIGFSVS